MTLAQLVAIRPFLAALRRGARAAVDRSSFDARIVSVEPWGLEELDRLPRPLFIAAAKNGLLAHERDAYGHSLYALTADGRAALRLVRQSHDAQERKIERLRAEIAELRDELKEVATGRFMDDGAANAPIDGLSKTQTIVVRLLEKQHGRLVTYDQIYDALRAAGSMAADSKIVAVQMAIIKRRRPDLREKIRTVWGYGYVFDGEPERLATPTGEGAALADAQ